MKGERKERSRERKPCCGAGGLWLASDETSWRGSTAPLRAWFLLYYEHGQQKEETPPCPGANRRRWRPRAVRDPRVRRAPSCTAGPLSRRAGATRLGRAEGWSRVLPGCW